VALRGGVEIPCLGSACSALPCAGLQRRSERLQGGYQHIDTATVYGEEADVAAGIRASGLDPAQVFITTKLGTVITATCRPWKRSSSRSRLGVDVIDAYLLHGPVRDRRLLSWRAVEHLLEEGRVRAMAWATAW
jgi:2,5-diketo-D-gluconate reductase A